MKALTLFILCTFGFFSVALGDNEDILQNSQALLEKARKADEERARQRNVDIFNPQKRAPDQNSASHQELNIKSTEDLLKYMKGEYDSDKAGAQKQAK